MSAHADKSKRIDLGLAVLDAIVPSGMVVPTQTIADVCGCTYMAVEKIEAKALSKLRIKVERAIIEL